MNEKKKLKKLTLKKETIAQLNQQAMNDLRGGCTNSVTCGNQGTETIAGATCMLTCDTPDDHCDFPTIKDSCFSLCYDKCNDY